MLEPHEVVDWARSGAVALSGRPDEPPRLIPGRHASAVREQLAGLGRQVPGLLGERAAYAGLSRRGPWSCGGAMRTLPTLDGNLALSLARPDDVALVPALVESEQVGDDPWDAVAGWARGASTVEVEDRLTLLGMPGGAVRTTGPLRPGVVTTQLGTRIPRDRPLVVDLTSLWAGPLCAQLIGLTGARVVKVESSSRPDGARSGPADFFSLLHDGHEQRVLDFSDPAGIEALRELIHEADLVLEASRPRALQQLGIDAQAVVSAGTSWLSLTAAGRDQDAVGFGDDIAARAGLVISADDDLLPAGDALADPFSGVRAAVEARAALDSPDAVLIDLSMIDLVAEELTSVPEHVVSRRQGSWWIEHDGGLDQVLDPQRRR